MVSKTVRDQIGWDDSYGLTSLAYKAERYFAGALAMVFPTSNASSSVLSESRGVDITFTHNGKTLLIQVKVTPRPELLPPTHLQETIERLERSKQSEGPQRVGYILITNYYLPPTMVESLERQGLGIFSFTLNDDDSTTRQRLARLIEQWLLDTPE